MQIPKRSYVYLASQARLKQDRHLIIIGRSIDTQNTGEIDGGNGLGEDDLRIGN